MATLTKSGVIFRKKILLFCNHKSWYVTSCYFIFIKSILDKWMAVGTQWFRHKVSWDPFYGYSTCQTLNLERTFLFQLVNFEFRTYLLISACQTCVQNVPFYFNLSNFEFKTYLLILICQTLNLELSSYFNYLLVIYEKCAVIFVKIANFALLT